MTAAFFGAFLATTAFFGAFLATAAFFIGLTGFFAAVFFIGFFYILKRIFQRLLEIKENSTELKFSKLDEFLDSNIFKIEKKLNSFIKDIYVILDSKEFHSIKLSIKKDNNGNSINSDTLIHPLNDLKNLCQSNLQNKKIIHFLIEKYVIDNKSYTTLPENINCNIFVFIK